MCRSRASLTPALEDIISSILPEDELGEVPTGFTHVGHVGMLILGYHLEYALLLTYILTCSASESSGTVSPL
jgi:hypothetical protein